MKKLFVLLLALIFATVACSSEPPGVRVVNQRSTKANVQVKQSDANTININDVTGGATTSYQEIAEGTTTATAVIQNESVSPTTSFTAQKDKNHTIVILNSNPPSLRVDTEDK